MQIMTWERGKRSRIDRRGSRKGARRNSSRGGCCSRSWWLEAARRIRIGEVKRRIPGRAAENAPDTRWNAAAGDWERWKS